MERFWKLGLGLCCVLFGCAGENARGPAPANAADARLAATEHPTPEASALVQQGESALAQNDAASAKTLFAQALAQNAQDARAALDLGIACEMLGDAPSAEAAYRKALAADANFAQAQNNLGVLLRERGALDEALRLLKSAVQASPDSAAAHQNLALAYEDAAQLPAASIEYARAVELAPNDAMTRANYGLLLLKQQQRDAATRELGRALQDATNNRPALLAIGNGLRRAGDASGALHAMELAVSSGGEPATPALLSELALAQRAAGQRDAALATLQKALGLDDHYATAHYLLANLLASEQRFPEAKQHYERYLKLEPSGDQAAQARERLAVIQNQKRK
jgi:Tfp pilus assembly protein PilF